MNKPKGGVGLRVQRVQQRLPPGLKGLARDAELDRPGGDVAQEERRQAQGDCGSCKRTTTLGVAPTPPLGA